MKKYLALYALVFFCFAEGSFAQLKIGNPIAQKTQLLQIPMVHIIPVESQFVPVHIDMLKPFTVSLNPIVFGDHENAACAHFKKLKATLVLKAERMNNVTANLDWETKYAFYATGFDVERSPGDSLHFETINFTPVSQASDFKINYKLPDRNDYNGVSFYRIRQRNSDTGFTYSNVVSIKGYDAVVVSVYPNPVSDKVWIDVLPKQSGNLTIMVYDPTGRMVEQQSASCKENIHVVQSINISKFAAGLYRVNVLMPDKSSLAGKFVKQ